MISASVLKQLGEKKLRVTGMPWQEQGEAREIGIGSLVSNCLCDAHNSALSPLDAVAGRFYGSVQECLFSDTPTKRHCLFSGHDVERWLLKTVAGLAAAKSLGANGVQLSGVFEEGIDVAQLLQDPTAWRSPMGMYVLQKLNDLIKRSDELGVAPLTTRQGEIAGLLTQLHGLTVALLIGQRETIKGSSLAAAPYRLMYLNANKADGLYSIELSWINRLG
jgi:hypothetical protein